MKLKCTMCGRKVDKYLVNKFEYQFRYGSKRDGDKLNMIICPECLDRCVDFIVENSKYNPIIETN